MKRLLLAVAVVLVAGRFMAASPAARDESPSRSIVKLYVTTVARDVYAPWRPGWNYQVTGSGAVIDGGRILTAAHVVNDQTFVQVRPNGTARKFRARVTFVSHVADGRLDGVPELGLAWQKLENPALKASVRLPSGSTGVLLTRVEAAPSAGLLREGDVLLSLAGQDVADDGTVPLRPEERTELTQATDLLPIGSRVAVRYLRDGMERRGELRLSRARGEGRLVPRLFDRNADYYLYGGLAFVALTRNLLDAAKDSVPVRIAALASGVPRSPGEEVVLLANVLSAEVNCGYEDQRWEVVGHVDGREVRSLADLVRLVERKDGGPFVVFGLAEGERVTVDRARATATRREVLARYEVASDRSPRLAALLGGSGAAAGQTVPSELPGLGPAAARGRAGGRADVLPEARGKPPNPTRLVAPLRRTASW